MEEDCHSRLLNIWTAETYYRQKIKSYTASIDTLIEVLRSDKEIMAILDTTYTRSLFPDLDTLETVYSMPLDSIKTCPETGLEYIITLSDSLPASWIAKGCNFLPTSITCLGARSKVRRVTGLFMTFTISPAFSSVSERGETDTFTKTPR